MTRKTQKQQLMEEIANANEIINQQIERITQANEDEANLKDQIETLLDQIGDLKSELEGMRPLRTMKFRMDEAIRTRFNTDFLKTHSAYERYEAGAMNINEYEKEPPSVTTEYAFLRYLSRIIEFPQEFDKEVKSTRDEIVMRLNGMA